MIITPFCSYSYLELEITNSFIEVSISLESQKVLIDIDCMIVLIVHGKIE